jgi:acetylornithine/N-succinyldiaminopimelate aminotransferase
MNTEHLMPTYGRLPVAFERGEGAWLYSVGGEKYLDALCGVAVTTLGHTHPAIVAAIKAQADKLLHVSNWFEIPEQNQLADAISEISEMDSVFFCNSGAEANEAAIKIARLYGSNKGISNPAIVVTQDAFHGRTMATISAGGSRKNQAGFEPLLGGFKRVPYDDLEAIRQVANNSDEVVAILVEPILGESGVVMPSQGYLAGLREICDQNEWLLMFDEIQTGMGRTGKWFAWQHENVKPDVMTMAKALGAGVPIGACVANGPAVGVLKPGTHGSTFGGGPLASVVGKTVIETMQAEAAVERAAIIGEELLLALTAQLGGNALVSEVRGLGLMLAVELNVEIPGLLQKILDRRLLVNVTGGGKIIRLLPPAIIGDAEIDQIVSTITAVLEAHQA